MRFLSLSCFLASSVALIACALEESTLPPDGDETGGSSHAGAGAAAVGGRAGSGSSGKGGTSSSAGKSGAGGSVGSGGSSKGGAPNAGAGGTGPSSGGSGGTGTGTGGDPGTGGGAGSFGTGGGDPGTGGFGTGGSGTGGSGTGGAPTAGSGGTSAGTGGQGSGGTGGAPDCTPVNPNATPQAKKLLCYIYSLYGNSVLSGQQETSWNPNPSDDVNWINTQTGKYPAILGGDYLYPNNTTSRARAYWEAGGITMIRYHMGAPPLADSYDNSKGSADINAVLTAGSSANNSFKSKLDYVARELATLQSANVPVLWAPFHEVQPNGWFWWAKGSGAQFVSLWKYMYDYLTTTKGLNNLVWLMPFSGSPDAAYYPGKEFVDLSGPDTYDKGQPFASIYTKARGIIGPNVPIPLHETGVIPNPDSMFPSAAPWVLFNIWAGYQRDTAQNSVANIKAVYANTHTITRDEVPNLK